MSLQVFIVRPGETGELEQKEFLFNDPNGMIIPKVGENIIWLSDGKKYTHPVENVVHEFVPTNEVHTMHIIHVWLGTATVCDGMPIVAVETAFAPVAHEPADVQ